MSLFLGFCGCYMVGQLLVTLAAADLGSLFLIGLLVCGMILLVR